MTTAAALPGWFRSLTAARIVAGVPQAATAVCHDSREVHSGAVFVAIPGRMVDGNAYISAAIDAGASAVVVQEGNEDSWRRSIRSSAAFIAIPDARVALAQASAGFYGHPARAMRMIGVTGTDGKTTTTHLIAHIFSQAGTPAGYLSSVEFALGASVDANLSHMTTLEATDVQGYLARMRDGGCATAVVEASSIGLDLHRVDECEFDVGVFTNLASDHLDYHRTMRRYAEAKAILFRMLDSSQPKRFAKAAIVNADDPAASAMSSVTSAAVTTYAVEDGSADLTAHDIVSDGFSTRFSVHRSGRHVAIRTHLLGKHNVYNCLAAIAAADSQSLPVAAAAQATETFPGVPGRMELVDAGQPFRVIIDIASTEQAMRNVLGILRPLTPGRLIVLFGAAGERDVERRSGIAHAVAQLADYAVITDEDPRNEDPDAILDEIAEALLANGFGDRFGRERDRREAMSLAFSHARADDTVLLAGKATEPSIVVGTTHIPWDERAVARSLLGRAGSGST